MSLLQNTVGIVVSSNNSTTTPLDAYGTFTGVADNLTSFSEIDLNLHGAPTTASGAMYFEFSPDGTHWDVSVLVSGAYLPDPNIQPLSLRVILPFFRVRYINGPTPQTEFRLTVVYHRGTVSRLTRFLNQDLIDSEGVEVTRSVIAGRKADGSYSNFLADAEDYLHTRSNQGAPATIDQSWFVTLTDGYNTPSILNTTPVGTEYGLAVRMVDGAAGTSSSFTSAFPAIGTAAGFNDGTNMQGARVFDLDSGGGTEYVLGVGLRLSGNGGSVEAGTVANPLIVDAYQAGTWNTAVSGTVTANQGTNPWTVGGTVNVGNTPSVTVSSGTITANQGTNPWTVSGTVTSNIGTTGGLALDSTFTGGTARTKITDGTNNVTVVSTADGYSLSVHTIPSGTQTVAGTVTANQGTSPWTVSGTVTANQGGAPWSSNITQFGSNNIVTGTGGSGSGIPRVTVANDSNILATQSGTWTVQQGTPPWSMVGTKTNAAATPGSNNIGTLSAVANVASPFVTDGYQTALSVDSSGALRVIPGPISAFGWPISATVHPISQQHFTYGIQPRDTKTFTSSGSTVVASGASGTGADMTVSIDTTANAFAIARSFQALHYRAGVGIMGLFTAAFNAGVANSQQFAGLWSPAAGYFVGYNGTTWGCFARTDGGSQIETLTVTTAATSASNVTVTLDGTPVTVAVTNQTGNPTRTAWEIAAGNFSTAGSAGTWGWDAFALGAVVYFIARRARVNSGSFSFSAGTTGSAATMALVRAGVNEVDDFGSPSSPGNWTFLDALDGTGPSGLNLNKSKSIIYGVSVGHLGHRGARMFVSHPISGQLICFADYRYMNTSTVSALKNPTLYVGWGLVSNGSTTAMTISAGSGMAGIEGELNAFEGERWSVSASKTATNGVACHYLSIRNGPVAGFGQTVRASRIEVRVTKIIISVGNAAAGNFSDIQILRQPTLSNLANFTQVDATRLGLWTWQDTTTTTALSSNGTLLLDPRVFVNTVVVLDADILVLEPGELLSVIVTPSTNMPVDVTMYGVEIQ